MPFIDLAGNSIRMDRPVRKTTAPASINTAGAATYTAAQVLNGIIVRDCAGSGRTDTLPTAALLLAALPGAEVGDVLELKIINGSDNAETITIAEGSGGGWDTLQVAGTRIIPQNTTKTLFIRITGVSTPAYVVYM